MKVATAVVTAVFCLALIGGSIEHVSGQTPTKKSAAKPKLEMPKFIGQSGRRPEVGDDGSLPRARVLQVIDGANVLVEMMVDVGLVRSPQMPNGYMDQEKELFWIVMPTAGMVDGRDIEPRGNFSVTGTKSYSTAVGTRTVMVIEMRDGQSSPPSVGPIAGPTSPQAPSMEQNQQSRIEAAKWRNWTSASGNHRTEAKFVRLVGGVVTLEKKDGSLIEVRLEQLCPEDQEFIQQRKWTKPDEAVAKNGNPPSASPPVTATLPKDKAKEVKEDPRSRWLNTTYNSTIYRVQGKQWAEIENTTQKAKWTLEERDRTPEYIELFNTTRKDTTRLFDKRMDVKEGDTWKWVSNGHWDRATGNPATINQPQ